MKTLGYTFVLAAAFTAALAHSTPRVSSIDRDEVTSVRHIANRAIETREVAKFEAIRVEGVADVLLSQDKDQLVQVDAEEGTAQQVTTSVENGVLTIRTNGNLTGKPVKVYVTVPSINDLSVEGTGNIIGMTPFTVQNLSIALSGAGNVQLSVHAVKVTSALFGSGNIDLDGTTTISNVTIEGIGDFHGKKLISSDVAVTSSGTGDAEVHAERQLRVALTGSGDVRYAGEVPEVKSTISGSGSVRKLAKG